MMPNSILVDTGEAVKRLRDLPHTDETTVWRLFITYVLEELVDRLRELSTARQNLMVLCKQIDKGRYRLYFSQHQALSEAVLDVGRILFEQFQALKLYSPDGILNYHYYPVHAPFFNDVLLLRNYELTCNLLTPASAASAS